MVLRMSNTLPSLILLILEPGDGFMIKPKQRVNSGFRREAAENCALLGYYAANSGSFP